MYSHVETQQAVAHVPYLGGGELGQQVPAVVFRRVEEVLGLHQRIPSHQNRVNIDTLTTDYHYYLGAM